MARFVVIGAGLGGLSAAIHLAAEGHAVRIVEAAATAGGKAGTFEVDGVRLDTGPSVLTLPTILDDLLAKAGRAPVDYVVFDPAFRYHFRDGSAITLHHRVDDTLDVVAASLGKKAADELDAFLDYAAKIWDAAAPSFVYGDAPRWSSLVAGGLQTLATVRRIDPLSTMKSAIESRVRDPHLRAILLRYATYNGSDPRRAPATLNCIAHVEIGLGGYGVVGGIHRMIDALVEAAESLGVELELDTRVERIVTRDGATRGVITERGELEADGVIANADAAHVFESLLPEVRPAPDERSMSGWTALVKTRKRDRVAHTVYFPEHYIDEFVDVFDEHRTPTDPTVYVCAPRLSAQIDPWPEHEALFVMVNAPTAEFELDEAAVEQEVLARLLSADAVQDAEVLWSRTPQDLAAQFPGTGGALYGAASNGPASAFKRPPNRDKKLRGLYYASGSAHPGGGMPLAMLSGAAAARAALEDL